jgi:hypothetical protein
MRALECDRSAVRHQHASPLESGCDRVDDCIGSRVVRRSQPLTPFAAPRLDHLSPSRRCHAGAKTMRLAPVTLLGLVRPLDGGSPENRVLRQLGPPRRRRFATSIAIAPSRRTPQANTLHHTSCNSRGHCRCPARRALLHSRSHGGRCIRPTLESPYRHGRRFHLIHRCEQFVDKSRTSGHPQGEVAGVDSGVLTPVIAGPYTQ